MIPTGSGVPTPQEPEITEEMIEAAARAYAKLEGNDYDAVSTGNRMAFYGAAGAILEAALAGRTVVALPEPDEILADATVWHVGPGPAVTVSVEAEDPTTVGFSDGHGDGLQLSATVARGFFTAGLAACERLASESRKDGDLMRQTEQINDQLARHASDDVWRDDGGAQ